MTLEISVEYEKLNEFLSVEETVSINQAITDPENPRETLDYLNSEEDDEGFLKKEFRKLRKLGGGVL